MSICLVSGVIGVALSAALAAAVSATGKFDMAIGFKAVIIASLATMHTALFAPVGYHG